MRIFKSKLLLKCTHSVQFTEAGVEGLNIQSKTTCIGWYVGVGVGQGSKNPSP